MLAIKKFTLLTKSRVWSGLVLNSGLKTKFARSVKSDKCGKTNVSDFPQQVQTISLGEMAGKDTKRKTWTSGRLMEYLKLLILA